MGPKNRQFYPHLHLITHSVRKRLDDALGGGTDQVLHFHRLKLEQRLAHFDISA